MTHSPRLGEIYILPHLKNMQDKTYGRGSRVRAVDNIDNATRHGLQDIKAGEYRVRTFYGRTERRSTDDRRSAFSEVCLVPLSGEWDKAYYLTMHDFARFLKEERIVPISPTNCSDG